MKVLMVLTSHDKLGDTGRKTGFWLEELAAPYYEFKDAGAQITLASPKGGLSSSRTSCRPRRHFLQGQKLGCPRRHRRIADHRPEPGLVRTDRQGPDRRP